MVKITKEVLSEIKSTISEVELTANKVAQDPNNPNNVTNLNIAIEKFYIAASSLKQTDYWNVKFLIITSLEKIMFSLHQKINPLKL